ncbi:DNA topoisomerase 4 subunit A [Mycoplasma sp. CSL7491-lung]|uniref:DNA topoisomerase (ATP-hydrolyzing) n=1 Tax=Mycoplasma sp. CSL7491-lung TaxID=549718 RepID=UPI001C11D001|nr:DNA topoisomerase (ATP-hydrolyzing) [Mycoplasma sp. CSL7491-lung]MBU4693142.1 DNA topoisomerase 4 subunit A [Mycoplasma sp. CSL7491-lung]
MKNKQIVENIIEESLDKIMSDRFKKYSKYVIQDRAIPDVKDGLKPVQRRILYSMFVLGLDADKPYKKSARIVGDVIGKYHPHGDSSVYEAMVNLSQWWKSNVPLLDMHGNIGSIDNDPAAAMRYTEVRLSKVGRYILNDLKKNTVAFVPNFDDSEIEPSILPSIFPTLLVNGTKGIAIGMATEMPPHNLSEIIDGTIALIKNPQITTKILMAYVKGPDFPTGGIIKGTSGIVEAFEYGQNKNERIYLYCNYKTYSEKNNQFIEITEIPFGINKSELVYKIDLIISNGDIDGVLDIKDRSDRNGINILITLDKDINIDSVLSYLFSKTDLRVSYSYNNTAIDNDQPKTLNLKQLLNSYVTHVKDIKTKTLTYDLEKSKLRHEIVLGFIKVAEIPDEVIKVIRNSEGSKAGVIENLIKHFKFTNLQATAIAELKLYRLSKTDKIAYLNEKEELEKTIKRIRSLLNNSDIFDEYIIDKLQEIKNEFGTKRKTKIEKDEFDVSYKQTDLIKEEEVYFGISKLGYIKRFSDKTYESNNISTYYLKEDDNLIYFEKANTMHNFLIFTNYGNYAIVPIYKINENKWKDYGTSLRDLVNLGPTEEVISIFEIKNWNSKLNVVLGTKNGYFKRTKLIDFEVKKLNKMYTAINLLNSDVLLNAYLSNDQNTISIITEKGLVSSYSELDISIQGIKAKGVKGVYLSLNDKVANFTINNDHDILILISKDGKILKINANQIPEISKTNKGKKIVDVKTFGEIIDLNILNNDKCLIVKTNDNRTYFDDLISYKTNSKPQNINIENFDIAIYKRNMQDYNFKNYSDFSAETIKAVDNKVQKIEKTIKQSEKNLDDLLSRVEKLLKNDK